jgi:putative methyltransferase (TIGR04325 family)
MGIRSVIGRLIEAAPVISDYYHHYHAFWRQIARCRGVYQSFDEARAAAPRSVPFGYSQQVIQQSEPVACTTAGSQIGALNQRDYPILFWLAPILEEARVVFNLGGNLGQEYYAYREKTTFPKGLRWVVCEIPEIVRAGTKLAAEREAQGLTFTPRFEEAEDSDVLLTCGTLQYLDEGLASKLGRLTDKPRHLLINRVPLYDGETYVTLQNLGFAVTPYRVQNRQELIDSMTAQGYQLIDAWSDWRTLEIPFHPDRLVSGYQGMYFHLDAWTDEASNV